VSEDIVGLHLDFAKAYNLGHMGARFVTKYEQSLTLENLLYGIYRECNFIILIWTLKSSDDPF
jgi:hypothetical protein